MEKRVTFKVKEVSIDRIYNFLDILESLPIQRYLTLRNSDRVFCVKVLNSTEVRFFIDDVKCPFESVYDKSCIEKFFMELDGSHSDNGYLMSHYKQGLEIIIWFEIARNQNKVEFAPRWETEEHLPIRAVTKYEVINEMGVSVSFNTREECLYQLKLNQFAKLNQLISNNDGKLNSFADCEIFFKEDSSFSKHLKTLWEIK
jgi:hypothetical protein